MDEDEEKPAISGFNGMIRFQNELVPKKNDLNVKDEDKDVKNVIKNSDQIYNSPSVFLKKNKKSKLLCSPSPPLLHKNSKKEMPPPLSLDNDKIEYENFIYKVSSNNKIKKYYLVLINKDIYYYKKADKRISKK